MEVWTPFCGPVYADVASLAVTKRSTGRVSGSAISHVTVGGSLPLSGSWFRGGVGQVTLKAAVNSSVTVHLT